MCHRESFGASVAWEPLLRPLPVLELADIHWVILGGESGPGAGPSGACCAMNSFFTSFATWLKG